MEFSATLSYLREALKRNEGFKFPGRAEGVPHPHQAAGRGHPCCGDLPQGGDQSPAGDGQKAAGFGGGGDFLAAHMPVLDMRYNYRGEHVVGRLTGCAV